VSVLTLDVTAARSKLCVAKGLCKTDELRARPEVKEADAAEPNKKSMKKRKKKKKSKAKKEL
jgi:hypothetical protein